VEMVSAIMVLALAIRIISELNVQLIVKIISAIQKTMDMLSVIGKELAIVIRTITLPIVAFLVIIPLVEMDIVPIQDHVSVIRIILVPAVIPTVLMENIKAIKLVPVIPITGVQLV